MNKVATMTVTAADEVIIMVRDRLLICILNYSLVKKLLKIANILSIYHPRYNLSATSKSTTSLGKNNERKSRWFRAKREC
jgi:hypothetical protein